MTDPDPTPADLTAQIAIAIAERDRLLVAFDVDAAKAFVVKHGGQASDRANWSMVLHLARFECESIRADHPDAWWESRIWLAKNGAVRIVTHPTKRECVVALDLIFPKAITDEYIRLHEKGGASA